MPLSDRYIAAIVELGLFRHPTIGAEVSRHTGSAPLNFEVFSLFVRSSKDLEVFHSQRQDWGVCMRGTKKASFWMLSPAEWDDFEGADFAGYVGRHSMFNAMRSWEASGVRTCFPHPADLYELITSKAWLASLCSEPRASLPAAIIVDKEAVGKNSLDAARAALVELNRVRAKHPFPTDEIGKPAPSECNAKGIYSGVVKLGWSWEARYVWFFWGEKQLEKCLLEVFNTEGCWATQCIVQEWVDFDFELRLFFFPPSDWTPSTELQPVRYEWTAWEPSNVGPGSFHLISREWCLSRWQNDEVALNSASEKAIKIANFLIGWLLLTNSKPVPMMRLDFMLFRVAPGKARVIFGEFCEMGACCLGWCNEGPPKVWRAALDCALE